MMEQYLRQVLERERVDDGPFSPALSVCQALGPIIRDWANGALMGFAPSGSFAKGTAVASGTDIDLFISLSSTSNGTLAEIYESLFNWVTRHGYAARRQNVSIGIRVRGVDVDLVPARQQDWGGLDHSLHRRKGGVWTKTNVAKHIAEVRNAGRADEIRLFKIWRNQHQLEWPSFYLELTVIKALSGMGYGTLDAKVVRVLNYLRDNFENARVLDPANTNNVISDDLTAGEKMHIARRAAALVGLNGRWGDFVR